MSFSRKKKEVLIVGDAETGKSNLFSLLTGLQIQKDYQPTIGLDFAKIFCQFQPFHIWDVSGQERFRKLTKTYYWKADIAILQYDMTRPETLEHIEQFYQDIKKERHDASFLLVGAKKDKNNACITYDEALMKAKKLGIAEECCLQIVATDKMNVQVIKQCLAKLANPLQKQVENNSQPGSVLLNSALIQSKKTPLLAGKSKWPAIITSCVIAASIAALTAAFWPALVALPAVAAFATATGLSAPLVAGCAAAVSGIITLLAGAGLSYGLTAKPGKQQHQIRVQPDDTVSNQGGGHSSILSKMPQYPTVSSSAQPQTPMLVEDDEVPDNTVMAEASDWHDDTPSLSRKYPC